MPKTERREPRGKIRGHFSKKRPASEQDVRVYLGMMNGFKKLRIPTFASAEHATEWGSHLNAEQHTLLVKEQRGLSYSAVDEPNLQLKVNLATQSQLMREAAEAFALTWAI